MMGVATLNGRPFRIDPTSIEWAYTIKTAVIETVGGRVVQIFGTDIDDMTVMGTFGVGGWQEQIDFLNVASQWAEGVANNPTGPPMRFIYPPNGWDFLVYLRAFSQAGGASVVMDNMTPAPPWMLTLFVIEDNTGLRPVKDAAIEAYITRLSQGIGWKQTEYNGPDPNWKTAPDPFSEVSGTLGGASVEQFVTTAFYPDTTGPGTS